MTPLMTALLALASALIGASAPVVVMLIQSRSQAKRERMKLISDLAIHDHSTALEAIKLNDGKGALAPLVLFMHHHAEVLRILEHRAVTAEDLEQIRTANSALIEVAERITRSRVRQ